MWAGILRFLQCTCLCIASVLYKHIFCELFYYLHVLLNSSLTCCFQQTPLPLLPPRFASQAQHYLTELSEVPWGKVPWFNKVSASSNQHKNGMALSGSSMCVVQDWNLRDLVLRFHWGLVTFLFRRISVLLRIRWKTPCFSFLKLNHRRHLTQALASVEPQSLLLTLNKSVTCVFRTE